MDLRKEIFSAMVECSRMFLDRSEENFCVFLVTVLVFFNFIYFVSCVCLFEIIKAVVSSAVGTR